jgi:predicted nucleic acid-binding protein
VAHGRVYLDSHLFRDKLRERYEGQHLKKHISASHLEVVVPQAVLGEIISVVMRDNISDINTLHLKVRKIVDEALYLVQPETCMPAFKFEMMGHITYIQRVCQIDPTDALIFGHAIHDPESEYFVTTDRKVLYNSEIVCYEDDLRKQVKRNRRLNITDWP